MGSDRLERLRDQAQAKLQREATIERRIAKDKEKLEGVQASLKKIQAKIHKERERRG
jgi:hypothetical protein